MMDGAPELSVGFEIDAAEAFFEIDRLGNGMDRATAQIIADAAKIERATGGMVKLGGATAQIDTFGNATTKVMRDLAREQANAERSGEGLVRQLTRQAENFGKTTAEIRQMRAELAATRAESAGLTELGGRIRAASSRLTELEASGRKAAASMGATRSAMAGLSFQAQDAFTQLSMGANAFSVLAIQGGQAAGQMIGMGGALGKVANFLIGPWGLALTAGTLVLGSLTKGLFENEEASTAAAEAMKQFQARQSDIGNFIDDTTGRLTEQNRVLVLNAILTRQARIDENRATIAAGGKAAFTTAREVADSKVRDVFAERGLGFKAYDRDLSKAIGDAQGNVDKLATSVAQLAKTTRPDLKGLALDLTGQAGAAILAQRENNKLAREIRGLEGDTSAFAKSATAASAAVTRTGAVARSTAGAFSQPRVEITETQRLLDQATQAAKDYAAAQSDLAMRTGLNARELRLYADAAAVAKAPTDELKQAIKDAAADREQTLGLAAREQFETNVLQPLRDEAALYGLVGPERERAALELEKQGFLLKQVGVSGEIALAMWEQYRELKLAAIGRDEAAFEEAEGIRRIGEELGHVAEMADLMARNVGDAARGMADAFGPVGKAIGDVAAIYSGFQADQARQAEEHHARIVRAAGDELKLARETARFERANSTAQIGLYGDMAAAAKGFFDEKSAGYKALMTAERVFRAFEFAMSVRAMIQDASETIAMVTGSAARATAAGAEGIANQSKLPFPFNIAAMAATGGALLAAGIAVLGSGGGGGSVTDPGNLGKGTVLGDADAQSQSIKRSIDALKEVDTLMLSASREMAASLRSIDRQIGGVTSQVLRAGDISASAGITEGFKPNIIGNVLGAIPLVGGLFKSLFGSTTTVTGAGLFAGPQSLASILGGGFQAQNFSDVNKTSKFLGIKTGSKNSTQYTPADAALEGQFTLILSEFNRALAAAAGPLGSTTSEIEQRLGGFIVNIGKIDLKGLTGEQVQEKLGAVFGAAADQLAATAFPGLQRFQKAGEGLFETTVRVASTVEQVSASLGMLGTAAASLGIDAQVALAEQFDSVGDFASAAQSYLERFYTVQEQAAARGAQFEEVFASLGLTMPGTLAAFRALVEAQNLTTAAGRETYATLLQLAPAFADMQEALNGARSAADILAERADLERKLLEVQGNTLAIRALDLAKLDPGNRALQEQIWALQDAQEAARAADDLRKAWQGIGDSIADEVKRIRGLSNSSGGGTFASALGTFNATSALARAGDQDAAKLLPGLSQALLKLAADNATSRQELERVQAQTAASLEETMKAIGRFSAPPAQSAAALIAAATAATPAPVSPAGAQQAELVELREELRASNDELRKEVVAAVAVVAANTGGIRKHLDNVTAASGGDSLAIAQLA